MKKNESIFISLQIQKDMQSKGLLLCVQFDKNAPNFSIESETILWRPTGGEIDFIAEAFDLIRGDKDHWTAIDELQNTKLPSDYTMEQRDRSSEIRFDPHQEDITVEVTTDSESLPSNKKENDDKIFIQVDEKKIDEILKRKKSGVKKDYTMKSDEKKFIDRMLKQKKKK